MKAITAMLIAVLFAGCASPTPTPLPTATPTATPIPTPTITPLPTATPTPTPADVLPEFSEWQYMEGAYPDSGIDKVYMAFLTTEDGFEGVYISCLEFDGTTYIKLDIEINRLRSAIVDEIDIKVGDSGIVFDNQESNEFQEAYSNITGLALWNLTAQQAIFFLYDQIELGADEFSVNGSSFSLVGFYDTVERVRDACDRRAVELLSEQRGS